MSASLVGSEMCIRDSALVAGARSCGGLRAALEARGPCAGAPAHLAPPVSYTHLTLPTICSV
eukprot:14713924-Alexandrium_andersonii.AAC.1